MIYKLQKELDKLLTRQEIHDITGIPMRTLNEWIQKKRLPVYHLRNGAKYGIKLKDVPDYERKPKKLIIKKIK